MGALNWNPEITKHNQRLHMQNQAINRPQLPLLFDQAGSNTQAFPLISAAELTAKPIVINWLIEDYIESETLNLLFGEPGSCKSAIALDWAFCIPAGIDWHGHRTKVKDTVILAGEGQLGMTRRLKALELKYGCKAPANLYISKIPAQLMDPQNAQSVAEAIKELCPNPGLVIIDTLHRNMDGDENSSQDIGKFINVLDLYLKPLGAAVLVVHHSGHGQKDRSRGSSSIRAAMDGEFSATKNEAGITLTCHKAKDFEAFRPMQFSLKAVNLDWLDDDGIPLTSIYLEHHGAAIPNTKKQQLTARDEVILTSLKSAVDLHGVDPTTELKANSCDFEGLLCDLKKVVSLEHWRVAAYPVLDADTAAAKQKAFTRARSKLFELGLVRNWNSFWWVV